MQVQDGILFASAVIWVLDCPSRLCMDANGRSQPHEHCRFECCLDHMFEFPAVDPCDGMSPSGALLMTPLVTIRDLDKSFPGVRALKKARFELLPGEVHALMGENGAGKSTLMKILAGIYRKDAGEILIEGEPVDIASPRAAQDLGISIIHQELNLMNELTAAQNIFIGREPKRAMGLLLDEEALNRAAADIFARMHLVLDPRAEVGELTVAKQQMVEIAKALSFRSKGPDHG